MTRFHLHSPTVESADPCVRFRIEDDPHCADLRCPEYHVHNDAAIIVRLADLAPWMARTSRDAGTETKTSARAISALRRFNEEGSRGESE